MKILLFILFISSSCYSQDSIRYKWETPAALDTTLPAYTSEVVQVKILKIKGNLVIMKTLERPRVKLFTFCKPPFKEKDIVWIKKP